MCNTRLFALMLARKCEILRWFPSGADGPSEGRTVTWLPKFLGWMGNQLFLAMELHSRAHVELRYDLFYEKRKLM